MNLDWDESIPDELIPRWNNWLADLAEINTVRVKRHIFEQDAVEEVELHTFTEASNVAYGAVVYVLRVDWLEYQETVRKSHDGEHTSRSAESLECSTSRIASRCVGSEIGSRSEEKLIEDREELYFLDSFD